MTIYIRFENHKQIETTTLEKNQLEMIGMKHQKILIGKKAIV